MARDFRLPDVGEGIREAEVIEWMVQEGDHVEEDQGVLEVETDKAIIEIPSPVKGEVVERLFEEGETAEVGDVIVRFETDSIQTPETDGSAVASRDEPSREGGEGTGGGGGRVFAAPSTRRLARERGVDIHEVEGSGPGGRVTQADVERHAERMDEREDLPTEVARRKAAKEFERRKWMDEEREQDEEDEGGGYETVFQEDDEEDVSDDAIIVGGEDEAGEGDGEVVVDDEEGDEGFDEVVSGDDSLGSEIGGEEDVTVTDDEERGLTPEFEESVEYADEEDDGLTPEFTEEVAYADDEDDTGLTPEFERDSTAVERTERTPEFGDEGGGHSDPAEPASPTETESDEAGSYGEEQSREQSSPSAERAPDVDELEGVDGEEEADEPVVDAGDVSEVTASPGGSEDPEEAGAKGRGSRRAADGASATSSDVAGQQTSGEMEAAHGSTDDGGQQEKAGEVDRDDVPYTGIRRRIGERLTEAVERPLVTHHDDVDVTRLQEVQDEVEDVTYSPFVVKACAAALQNHPMLNSTLDEEEERIRVHDDYHVGVATATDDGLLVPVLRDVDEKDIAELSRELDDLVERARNREIEPQEMKDSTFTVTNVGAIGGEYSTPIVNGDEAAILAVGEVRRKPRVVGDDVVPRYVVNLSLTFDHRIVDGADAARFTNEVRRYLRKPALLLVD